MKPGISEMYFRAAEAAAGPVARADIAVSHAVKPLQHNPVVKRLKPLGDWPDQMPLNIAAAGLVGAGLLAKNERMTRLGVRLGAAHLVAMALKQGAKALIRRPRPNMVSSGTPHEIRFPGHRDPAVESFPSGHSTGAVMAARTVARIYPEAAPVAYAAAATAGAAQVVRQDHFLSDVLAGVVLGVAADLITTALFRRFG